jgi:glycosyltransferase involved in cell wall biosynthesis
MRVTYISQGSLMSGAERSLQTHLRFAQEVGIEPSVICSGNDKLIPWLAEQHIQHFCCPIAQRDKWHPFRWWNSVHWMHTLLRKLKPDVVHANHMWCYASAAAAAQGLGVPRVCHLRNDASAINLRWICKYGVEALVCISRHVARQAEVTWPASGPRPILETMINPVVLPEIDAANAQERKRRARHEIGVNENAVVLGFLGQLIPQKGTIELIEAVAELQGSRKWQLAIAGRDPNPGKPYERRCRARVQALGLAERVRFLGFLDDVSTLYKAIDVAVVPSLEEPLGRVPLEAGAYGKPSIAFATGGLPEIVRDGETGWLAPRGDITRLRETLREFIDRPDLGKGMAARRWVESIADPRGYERQLVGLYERLLKRAAANAPTTNGSGMAGASRAAAPSAVVFCAS